MNIRENHWKSMQIHGFSKQIDGKSIDFQRKSKEIDANPWIFKRNSSKSMKFHRFSKEIHENPLIFKEGIHEEILGIISNVIGSFLWKAARSSSLCC